MLLKAITVAGGIAGAAGLSQFPEFSQQYVQRLGGAVDELSRFVAEFDADAQKLGLSREAALDDLAKGGAMGQQRARTMGSTLARHARLSADLQALQSVGPFTRAYRATRLTDGEIAANAWAAYKPALPLTFEGASFAGIGFLGGFAALALMFRVLGRVFRRRAGRRKSPQSDPAPDTTA